MAEAWQNLKNEKQRWQEDSYNYCGILPIITAGFYKIRDSKCGEETAAGGDEEPAWGSIVRAIRPPRNDKAMLQAALVIDEPLLNGRQPAGKKTAATRQPVRQTPRGNNSQLQRFGKFPLRREPRP